MINALNDFIMDGENFSYFFCHQSVFFSPALTTSEWHLPMQNTQSYHNKHTCALQTMYSIESTDSCNIIQLTPQKSYAQREGNERMHLNEGKSDNLHAFQFQRDALGQNVCPWRSWSLEPSIFKSLVLFIEPSNLSHNLPYVHFLKGVGLLYKPSPALD